MKQLNFLQIIYFCFLFYNILKSKSVVGVVLTNARPNWASYENCPLKLPDYKEDPIFTMCDPDEYIKHDAMELGIHKDHVRQCFLTLQAKNINYNSTKAFLFFIQNVIQQDSQKGNSSLLQSLMSSIQNYFNLTSIPAIVVIVNYKNFEILEWYSKPLREKALRLPMEMENRYKLYGSGKDIKLSMSLSYNAVCDVIIEMFHSTPFDHSSILWLLLAVVLTVGLFGYACWLYRFHKNHPTEEEDTNDITYGYEMSRVSCNDDGLYKSSKPMSDFVLLGAEVEAASHEPAKSATVESIVHL